MLLGEVIEVTCNFLAKEPKETPTKKMLGLHLIILQ